MHPGDVVLNHASTVRDASPISGLSGLVVYVPPPAVEIAPGRLRTPEPVSVVIPAGSMLPSPEESAYPADSVASVNCQYAVGWSARTAWA